MIPVDHRKANIEMFAEENWEYRFKAHFDNSGVPWQCLWISKGSQQKVKSVSNGDDKGELDQNLSSILTQKMLCMMLCVPLHRQDLKRDIITLEGPVGLPPFDFKSFPNPVLSKSKGRK